MDAESFYIGPGKRIGWSDMLAFLHYGEQFHKHRKLSQQPFTRKRCLVFRETQVLQSHILLHNLLTAPEGFENHARRRVKLENTTKHAVHTELIAGLRLR